MGITLARKPTVDCIRDIEREVEELHPLLHALFRKLPGITKVEYRQGPSEMGADFILHKYDEALLRTTHIGVVAKVGQIKQNTTEVERQIKECFVPRKGADAQTVNLKEVWVVTTKEITNNARDVINKLYADNKVEFVGGQELAGLVDRHAPDAFVTASPAMQDYSLSMSSRMEEEDRRSSIVPQMDHFYLEPSITRIGFDGYGKKKTTKKLANFEEFDRQLKSSHLSIVQAGAGGGKSQAARQLVRLTLASDSFAEGKTVPALIHARDCRESLDTAVSAARKSVSAPEAKVIAYIDGFDELDINDSERSHIIRSWSEFGAEDKNVSIVVFSRPFDDAMVLGGKIQSTDMFRIEPLSGSRALTFISKIAGDKASSSRLIRDLKESILMRALEGAPIAYILLGRLILENEQDLPSNLTELFQKYLEISLGRWEISKGFRSQKEYEVLVETYVWLAKYMLDNKLQEVAFTELEQWIRQYVQERTLEVDAVVLARRACERNSLLYMRKDTGVVGFRHRAFAEFFYASGMTRTKDLDIGKEVYGPYWVNTYYFYVGMFKDCPELLEGLLTVEVEKEQDAVGRIAHFGSFLLAAYLTPTRTSKVAIVALVRQLAEIYVRACDPSHKSPLGQFPTMQLLCLLTHMFRGSYGYKFFRSALAEAIYEFEGGERDQISALSLFFLDSAYREAGGDLRFDELIGRFGDQLPLVVKLAIGHESDRMKATSDAMARMERNLRRTLQANKSSSVFLKNLYDMPIKKLDRRLA